MASGVPLTHHDQVQEVGKEMIAEERRRLSPGKAQSQLKKVEDALKNRGLRMTMQRKIILEYISSTRNHPTAEEAYQELNNRDAAISIATVYKTLRVLKELGLIRVLSMNSGVSRYETNLDPHINQICITCGKIIEVAGGGGEELIPQMEDNFQVTEYRMECFGYCSCCRTD